MRLALRFWSRTRVASTATAAACLGLALWLALHHPIAPWAAALLVLFSVAMAARWRGFWLVAIPGALPWLDFSPWTGWQVVSEFDIFLLAVFAGAYGRMARSSMRERIADPLAKPDVRPAIRAIDLTQWILLLALALSGLIGLVRGLIDAGGLGTGWFQSYADPLNSLRVAKSLVFGLLTVALSRDAITYDATLAGRRLASGMLLGLGAVALAVLWERTAYPGFFDFGRVYRATALFWEMHVGGAAIDAYLALAMPFAWWAVSVAHRRWSRLGAVALAIVGVYVCLVTFSRNVYLAVALPALVLAVAAWLRPVGRIDLMQAQHTASAVRRTSGSRMSLWIWLLFAAIGLAIPQWGAGSFLLNRLQDTGHVMDARLVHWQRTLSLPANTTEQIWGVGLGRFSSRYDQSDRSGGFPGQIEWHAKWSSEVGGRDFVKLRAAQGRRYSPASFGLTQRVSIVPGARYQVELELRAATATTLKAEVCERHLLYNWDCQYAVFRLPAGQSMWSRQTQSMQGPVFRAQPWYAPRLGMMMLTVLNAGGEADVRQVALTAGNTSDLVHNGDFGDRLARWFPAAQYHYLPWHADSLYLELLVERGWTGLIVFASLLVLALWRLSRAGPACVPSARFLGASLCAALLAGVFGSVMDAPRVAFLIYFLALFALQLPTNCEKMPPRPDVQASG